MELRVRVDYTLNGIVFNGTAKGHIENATRDGVLAFMAAQGEADWRNRAEIQRRGMAIAKAARKKATRVCLTTRRSKRNRT